MKVHARATDYHGHWTEPKGFIRAWLWDYQIAKPYFLWTAAWLLILAGMIVGYMIGIHE